jgi:hypothetical protein
MQDRGGSPYRSASTPGEPARAPLRDGSGAIEGTVAHGAVDSLVIHAVLVVAYLAVPVLGPDLDRESL